MARDPVLIHAANAAKAGAKYHIDPAVIMGILKQEGGTDANGKPVAPGDGAGPPSYGQFTFGTGKSLGIKFGDSASEVDGIARYLNSLGYQKDPKRAIAAYNGGPGNPQYSYAEKVLALAKGYKGIKGSDATTGAQSGASGSGQPIGQEERSAATKALVWIAFVLGGFALAALGIARMFGLLPSGAGKVASHAA